MNFLSDPIQVFIDWEMDEDWLEDPSGPSRAQGGSTDPLADREWERLSTRYSDVSWSHPCKILLESDAWHRLAIGKV